MEFPLFKNSTTSVTMPEGVKFDTQYHLSYLRRLKSLKSMMLQGSDIKEYTLPIRQLNENLTEECIIIAIFFLCSDLKPSILEQSGERTRISSETYMSKDVKYYIEDESGKLELKFQDGFNQLKAFISGMVLGFVGNKGNNNVFYCNRVIFPSNPVNEETKSREDRQAKILFISNPEINHSGIARLKVLVDSLKSQITSTIILGNLFSKAESPDLLPFNKWIGELRIPVYIVPSLHDPTTSALPQEPIYTGLLTKDRKKKSYLVSLTNPAQVTVDGVRMALISEHVLTDMTKYVPQDGCEVQYGAEEYRMHLNEVAVANYKPETKNTPDNALDILEQLLKLKHLAPCAPDTLEAVPYSTNDPFILGDIDLIAGGDGRGDGVRWCGNILILSLPNFRESGSALLYDVGAQDILRVECTVPNKV